MISGISHKSVQDQEIRYIFDLVYQEKFGLRRVGHNFSRISGVEKKKGGWRIFDWVHEIFSFRRVSFKEAGSRTELLLIKKQR